MQTVTSFSGSTTPTSTAKKFDWSNVADGNIHQATSEDYKSQKGFLVSMSRWANENGYSVERYASPDGNVVEFRLTASQDVPVPSDEDSEDSEDKDENPDEF